MSKLIGRRETASLSQSASASPRDSSSRRHLRRRRRVGADAFSACRDGHQGRTRTGREDGDCTATNQRCSSRTVRSFEVGPAAEVEAQVPAGATTIDLGSAVRAARTDRLPRASPGVDGRTLRPGREHHHRGDAARPGQARAHRRRERARDARGRASRRREASGTRAWTATSRSRKPSTPARSRTARPCVRTQGHAARRPGRRASHCAIGARSSTRSSFRSAGLEDARRAVEIARRDRRGRHQDRRGRRPAGSGSGGGRRVVSAAHRAKIRVAAHATSVAGIQAAIDGGVDSVEHGDEATDAMLTRMRDKGITLVPIAWTAEALRDVFIARRVWTDVEKVAIDKQIASLTEAHANSCSAR